MNVSRRIVTLVAIVIVVAVFVFLSILQQPETTMKIQKVSISVPGIMQPSLIWISEAKGYFKEEGLDVSILNASSGRTSMQAMQEGKADLAVSGDFPIALSALRGEKIYIIAEIATSDEGRNIIGRKDRGILVPEDFRGKRIGVTLRTVDEFQLVSFLNLYGLSESEVTLVDMAPQETFDALVSGKVDALSTWQNNVIRLEKELGQRISSFDTKGIYIFTLSLVGRQEFVNQNPEVARKVLRALVRAEKFMQENPTDARLIIYGMSQTDLDTFDEVWGYYDFRVTLRQSLLLTLEDEARWAMGNRITNATKVPNYLRFIDSRQLDAVKPNAVTIIR